MKVTVTDREVERSVENRKYPYYGKSKQCLVLFDTFNSGMVIRSESTSWSVGDYIDTFNEREFEELVNKTITIEV